MINRKCLWGLFSIFFITIIFAEGNRVLWDLGVVINTSIQQTTPNNVNSLSHSTIESYPQTMALIANPFISPTLSSIGEKVYDIPNILESANEIPLKNIHQIKLLASWFTININYPPIIEMISKIDFSKLEKNNGLDLNYWLANALLHTGQCTEAQDILHTNMALTLDDRSHFLLAMTYECQGEIREAQEEYLEFIKQFPNSDYKVTALIKSRMLGRR